MNERRDDDATRQAIIILSTSPFVSAESRDAAKTVCQAYTRLLSRITRLEEAIEKFVEWAEGEEGMKNIKDIPDEIFLPLKIALENENTGKDDK